MSQEIEDFTAQIWPHPFKEMPVSSTLTATVCSRLATANAAFQPPVPAGAALSALLPLKAHPCPPPLLVPPPANHKPSPLLQRHKTALGCGPVAHHRTHHTCSAIPVSPPVPKTDHPAKEGQRPEMQPWHWHWGSPIGRRTQSRSPSDDAHSPVPHRTTHTVPFPIGRRTQSRSPSDDAHSPVPHRTTHTVPFPIGRRTQSRSPCQGHKAHRATALRTRLAWPYLCTCQAQ